MSSGRLFAGAQASYIYVVSWVQSPRQSGILKGVTQVISVVSLHSAEMAMGMCLNPHWYVCVVYEMEMDFY